MSHPDPNSPPAEDPQAGGTGAWVGRRLEDRYVVVSCLGRGGMGTTWLARDEKLRDREVVIKVPHPELRAMPEFSARYEREIRSMIDLAHPHVVEVLDLGDHEGAPFVVMQYISGGSLAARLASTPEGRLAPGVVLPWLLGIAQALDFMHARDLLHRDVKPENILISRDGVAYLADFGIAKAVGPGDVDLTTTGFAPGTPKYMAPEQARSNEFSGEADQYALGITAYEALSGRLPFSGATPVSLLLNKQTEAPAPLDDMSEEIPSAAADVLKRAMAIEPGERFESCSAFLQALYLAFELGTPIPAAFAPTPTGGFTRGSLTPTLPDGGAGPAAARRRPGHLLGIVGALALLGVLLAVWQPWAADKTTEEPPKTTEGGGGEVVDLSGGGATQIDALTLRNTLLDVTERFGGRATPGERLDVARWIAGQFRLYGLEPLPGRTGMVARGEAPGGHRLHNVYAWLPGSLAEQAEDGIGEYLIVSAHYDGLGRSEGRVYPGADNNGSGVVALMEMARAMHEMKERGWPFRRSILFAGLDLHHGDQLTAGVPCAGARHLATQPPIDLKGCTAFIALEQLGRSLVDLLPRSLIVLGTEKSGVLDRLAGEQPYEHGLLLRVSQDIYAGVPDTAPFLARKIPSLYVTAGNSRDYKQFEDTVERIDFESFARRLEWLREFLHDVANEPQRADWREDSEPTLDEVRQILAAFELANQNLQAQKGAGMKVPQSVMSGIGVITKRLEKILEKGSVTPADRRFYVGMLKGIWANAGLYRDRKEGG